MKVKLAAQTFSTSVADALDYLSNNSDDFTEATATIEFIRQVCNINNNNYIKAMQLIKCFNYLLLYLKPVLAFFPDITAHQT